MNVPKTTIQILDSSLNHITDVITPHPLDNAGHILRYSKELSDFGKCTFRISAIDPMFKQYGDFLVPHRYHVRILRGTTIVWAGAIINNKIANRTYVEVEAAEYIFYLGRKRIHRDVLADPTDPLNNYRIFSTGTMATAVTAIMNETIADYKGVHVLAGMTLGTIENPDFPNNFVKADGTSLTGTWTFSSDVTLQFDYQSVLYVLKQMGIYSTADFQITPDLVFNFKKFIGRNNQYSLVFQYGEIGSNIVDYNVTRIGQRVANDLMGIATDNLGNILHVDQRDATDIATYGLMEDTAAYSDVKNANLLTARLTEELLFTSSADDGPINIVLDENGYPLGQYDIGDIVTVKIKNGVINYNKPRRIVGITVYVHNAGREVTTVATNKPRPQNLGAV